MAQFTVQSLIANLSQFDGNDKVCMTNDEIYGVLALYFDGETVFLTSQDSSREPYRVKDIIPALSAYQGNRPVMARFEEGPDDVTTYDFDSEGFYHPKNFDRDIITIDVY